MKYLFTILCIACISACAQTKENGSFPVKLSLNELVIKKFGSFKGYIQEANHSIKDDLVIDSFIFNKGEANIKFNAKEGNLYYIAFGNKASNMVIKLYPFVADGQLIPIPLIADKNLSPANSSLCKLMKLTGWLSENQENKTGILSTWLDTTNYAAVALYASEALIKENADRFTIEKIIRKLNEKFPKHLQVSRCIKAIQEFYPQYITGKNFEVRGTINPEESTGKVYLKTLILKDQSKYSYENNKDYIDKNFVLVDSSTINAKGEFTISFKSVEERVYMLDFERLTTRYDWHRYNPNENVEGEYVTIRDEAPKPTPKTDPVTEKSDNSGQVVYEMGTYSESEKSKPEVRHEAYVFINDKEKINIDIIAGKKIESNSPATNLYNKIQKYAYQSFYSFDPHMSLKINGKLQYKTIAEKKPHIKKYFEEYQNNMLEYIQNTPYPGVALTTARILLNENINKNINSSDKKQMAAGVIKILSEKFPGHLQITNYVKLIKLNAMMKGIEN